MTLFYHGLQHGQNFIICYAVCLILAAGSDVPIFQGSCNQADGPKSWLIFVFQRLFHSLCYSVTHIRHLTQPATFICWFL